MQLALIFAMSVLLFPVVEGQRVVTTKTEVVLSLDGHASYPNGPLGDYQETILSASAEFNVPASLIAAVIKAESGFDPHAVSPAGAMGLMQLMPKTWGNLGGTGSPFNPELNIRLGTKYLRELLDQFKGDYHLTIAAYNAGPGAVQKYRRIPPFRETRQYVPRVMKYYKQYTKVTG